MEGMRLRLMQSGRATLDAMGRHRLLVVALAGFVGCEQHFSSEAVAPETFAAASSAGALDTFAVPGGADAGAGLGDSSHAMTVSICSQSSPPCPSSEGDASAEARYRVVYGSGRGGIRSRGQAMADLYQVLRDRTASGERLDAEPRAPLGAPAVLGAARASSSGEVSGDPLSQSAFRLLDLVDRVGEVTLDAVHGVGSRGCKVSLGRSADGGASQCLVQDPDAPKGPEGKGPGVSW
jgi:hypothetical protein